MNGSELQIAVTRLDHQNDPVEFVVESIDFPPAYVSEGEAKVSLICSRWEPGGVYRIGLDNVSIDVRIDAEPFVGKSADIDIWEDMIGTLRVAAGGSCSERISAHRIGIEMTGDDIERWMGSLLYLTMVDGQVWRPRSSVCSLVYVGESWVGVGRELLYSACDSHGNGYDRVLDDGVHVVTMIAWLPGIAHVTATREVVFGCPGDQ